MAVILGRKPGGGGSGPGSGVTSIAKSGDSGLTGAVTLSEGSGVTLTQVGQDIEVAAADSVKYAALADYKADGTAGGAFNNAAWRTRDLNTEVYDPDGIVSLAANQFTLQAGTYIIDWVAPAIAVNSHATRLFNVTDAAEVAVGGAAFANSGTFLGNVSPGTGMVTIASAKAFAIEHQCETTKATDGFGAPTSFAVTNEVYTQVWIRKIA